MLSRARIFALVSSGNLRRDVFGSTFPGTGICAFDAGGIRVGGPRRIAQCTTALIFHFDLTGIFVRKANLIFGLFERQIWGNNFSCKNVLK